ncbi:MAG: sodium:calcium antiporter [Bacteroidetes bacterium]|nr:MAG: sodium:calcium antiporter [Bacteroidota bacterium]RLD96288.1 MAG: sodium:calcium antiporter [Bacteroidota bacterium]
MAKVYLLLFVGLALLFVSGKFLVDSSVAISRRLKIPRMIIGLTVVAFGTSAPELLVSLQAAFSGYPEIVMGNVVGSNISNILLVLAITALIFPIPVPASSVKRDWPIMMAVSLLLYIFAMNGWISRLEGVIFVVLLGLYILYSVLRARSAKRVVEQEIDQGHMKWGVAGILLLVSIVGLAFGADLLVENAALVAEKMGMSKRVVSITMVAVGTSIPEVATSVIAALKKETDISVGNIIGSNIMNILSVLGFTSLVSPISVSTEIAGFDIPWMLGISLLFLLLMLPASRSRITRWEGSLMIVIYLVYIYFLF